MIARAILRGCALAAWGLLAAPSLNRGSAGFSKFPDSVDASVPNPRGFLQNNWDCRSADVFSVPGGLQLAVCGSLQDDPARAGTYRIRLKSDFFFVVARNGKGTTRLLHFGGGWGGNPSLLERKAESEFSVVEGLEDGSRFYPLFRTPIGCDRSSCSVGQEVCALAVPAGLYPDVVRRLTAEKDKDHAHVKRGEQYLDLVTGYSRQLLLRALGGDEQAAGVLARFPLKLDGAPAELVDADRKTYAKAKEMGCLAAAGSKTRPR